MRTAYTTSALALVAAAASGLAMDANAILLTQGDSHYIGFVKDGEPADFPTDILRVNSLLDMSAGAALTDCTQVDEDCSRVGSSLDVSGFADATVTGAIKSLVEDPSNLGINITGFTYLLGKYDGPNFGDLVWYVGDLTGTVDIQLYGSGEQYRLSHWALYNPGTTTRVPEPGTLTLLSMGLLAVGFSARRRKA